MIYTRHSRPVHALKFSALSSPGGVATVIVSFLVTIATQQRYLTRVDNFGRPPSPAAAILFSLNGIFETPLFLTSYCTGASMFGKKRPFSRFIAGFSSFFMYSWVIHYYFWQRQVLPLHIRRNARPFMTDHLPFLLLMSATWLFLFDAYDDVITVMLLHCATDYSAAVAIHLPFPQGIRHLALF